MAEFNISAVLGRWGHFGARAAVKHASQLLLVVGAAVTMVSSALVLEATMRTTESRFDAMATRLTRIVENQAMEYEELIHFIQNYFDTTAPNTRSEFQRYVPGIDLKKQYPAVDWIAFARRVEHADLAWYQRTTQSDTRVNEDGLPLYRARITARRPAYYFFEQVIPAGVKPADLGTDLAGDDKLSSAIDLARRNENIIALYDTKTVLTPDGASLVVSPVFDRLPRDPGTDSSSRTLLGIVVAQINTEALFLPALANEIPAGYGVQVYLEPRSDGTDVANATPIFSLSRQYEVASGSVFARLAPPLDALTLMRTAAFGNAPLRTYVSADPHVIDENWHLWPAMTFLFGVVTTTLLYLYARASTRSRLQAVQLAAQMERAARDSDERFRSMVESSSDWIWEIDNDYRVVYASPNTSAILGYEVSEIIGASVDLLATGVAAGHSDLFPFSRTDPKRYSGFERELRRKDGQPITLESSGAPFQSSEGRFLGIRGIDRDVTARRKLQDRLSELRIKLSEVTQFNLARQVLSGVAHELNQPLSAIILFNQASIRLLERGNGESREVADAMHATAAQAQLASDIIKRMRQFVSTGGSEIAAVGMGPLIREAIELAAYRLKSFGIRLQMDIEGSLPEVQGDRVLMIQVMLNLVHNAVEALGAVEDRRLAIRAFSSDRGRVNVEIADSGPGIAPEAEALLFSPQFTTKPRGMGLGLTICRSIVEAHEGELTFGRSVLGGARFTISLPTAARPISPDAAAVKAGNISPNVDWSRASESE